MEKITQLTVQQKERFAEFRDRWVQIGLCTEPADRPRAEAALRQIYSLEQLPPPEKIVWCDSPLYQGSTQAIISSPPLNVRASARKAARKAVGEAVGVVVRASVWEAVAAPVAVSVAAHVAAYVRASLWEAIGEVVRGGGYGQHDATCLSFYEYFRIMCGLEEETHRVSGHIELAKHAGWYLPYQRVCWISERPHLLRLDEQGRLHSVSGPACAYPDGWSIYAVHGVRVPGDIIEHPEGITVQRIEQEQNAAVRRIMIELNKGEYATV